MKLIFRAMGRYRKLVALAILVKLVGTLSEFLIPYILEHIIDVVVPTKELKSVIIWGFLMFATAFVTRTLNVQANRLAIRNAHSVSFDIRQQLFEKTANLSGSQFDRFGLPSLISRMTSDSYNVQSAVQFLQSMCVRSPMMLIGGVTMTLVMDRSLAMILLILLPLLVATMLFISWKGIPMFQRVQEQLDTIVRIMRENITGIRVIKALSREDYEKRRFLKENQEMAARDIRAGMLMAIPGPFMQFCLNAAMALVVIAGARRVDAGLIKPGIILAILTYINMLTMGIMGLNRIFVTLSKASVSANRIGAVLACENDQEILPLSDAAAPSGEDFIRFENVCFSYGGNGGERERAGAVSLPDSSGFAGEERERALDDISFSLKKGESLGIIGPTGGGKTTIINLLMRFYDADSGAVFVDGRDVRTYETDELRRKFGVVFQNDMVFRDTLRENIDFGRGLREQAVRAAVEDAQATEYVDKLNGGLSYRAAIKGANLSGGQKQRLLVARGLAGSPEILVLDDSSSALDYQTDAAMRRAVAEHYPDSTLIMIAQRVSSVAGMTHILVMDNGRCIGQGSHEELMESCPEYREICEVQMGAMES